MNSKDKYVLIDSSGILHHQYFGLKDTEEVINLKTNNLDIDIKGLIGYFRFFNKLKEEYSDVPIENFIHILDSDGSDYRKSIYPEYKAHRKEKEEALLKQKELLGTFLQAFDYKFVQIHGVEADDIIGSYTKQLTLQNKVGLIVSYDKDLFQLLNDNIALTRDEKGKDGIKRFAFYTKNYIEKTYGFEADTFADFLAFKGDISDNIKGVKGIGDVAAKSLLQEYPNVEMVLQNLDKIKPSIRKKIEEHKEDLILSKKLTVILRDIPVPKLDEITNTLPLKMKEYIKKIVLEKIS